MRYTWHYVNINKQLFHPMSPPNIMHIITNYITFNAYVHHSSATVLWILHVSLIYNLYIPFFEHSLAPRNALLITICVY